MTPFERQKAAWSPSQIIRRRFQIGLPKEQVDWEKAPEEEDYKGALTFLSLVFPVTKCEELLRGLRGEPNVDHAAKDLLRASNLPLLPRDEPHVESDLKRIEKGKSLAPVLLARGDMAKGVPLIVADGYHRICAAYYRDESAPILCRIVNIYDFSV